MQVVLRKEADKTASGKWTMQTEVPITIGRSQNSTIHIPHFTVSRQHAKVFLGENGTSAYFEDLDSANGSIMNGVRITGKIRIPMGAEITIGDSGKVLMFNKFVRPLEIDKENTPAKRSRGFQGSPEKDKFAKPDFGENMENIDFRITTVKKPTLAAKPSENRQSFIVSANKSRPFESHDKDQDEFLEYLESPHLNNVLRNQNIGCFARERSRSRD